MASLKRKFRKLQRDPSLFVKDALRKRLGASKGETVRKVHISSNDVEIIDGLAVIGNPELVMGLAAIKGSGRQVTLTIGWRQ